MGVRPRGLKTNLQLFKTLVEEFEASLGYDTA